MTDIQKIYKEVIVAVDGRKGITFEKAIKETVVGNAGIAIAISVLNDGNIKINHLKSRIPDFTQTEIRIALSNLRKGGYFVFDKKDKLYRLSLISEGDRKDGVSEANSLIWALLCGVAQGWLRRK